VPYSTIVAGTNITASWANANVRDQVVTPFASTTARDSAITSPLAGMVATINSNDVNEGPVVRTSAGTWRPPWNTSWGVVGFATKSAMQTNVGTGTTDVTGLSAAITAVVARLYRMTTYCYVLTGTAASFPNISIRDGGNNQRALAYPSGTATPGGATTLTANAVGFASFAAGAQTLKTSVAFTVNTNNQAGGQSIFDQAFILVDDVGPSGAPT
jgi:hypothetical protein